MPMSSKPPVGAIAYGRSGLSYIIEALETDQILLKTPEGLKRVPLNAVTRWELPPAPRPIQLGDRVRLKGTQAEYVVIELYDHFMGWQDGDRTTEACARLQTDDGKPATWKIQQLEAIV
jgi:D-serine deaminase-like pyridoxal phosphate-dependent protein